MMEADIALAVLVPPALRIGGGDPEPRLAVPPAGHVRIFVFQLEAEEAEQLVVERLRAREIADAEHQMIDADDAGHDGIAFGSTADVYSRAVEPCYALRSSLSSRPSALRAFTRLSDAPWRESRDSWNTPCHDPDGSRIAPPGRPGRH